MSIVDLNKFAGNSPSVKIHPALGYAAFDADGHYYEAEDALTRHLPAEWKRRGPKWATINGRKRLMLGDTVYNFIPNPTFDPVGKPGALHDYYAAKLDGADIKELMKDLEPIRPEYRDRDVRLKVMDEQGVGASWMFPTLGVALEVSYQSDIDACLATLRAFNRWLQEDWGFAYKDRIFAAPFYRCLTRNGRWKNWSGVSGRVPRSFRCAMAWFTQNTELHHRVRQNLIRSGRARRRRISSLHRMRAMMATIFSGKCGSRGTGTRHLVPRHYARR